MMTKKNMYQFKSMAVIWLCFCSISLKAQTNPTDKPLRFNRQWRFSAAAVAFNKLKLSHQGTEHLLSLPTLSGELTVSYLHHIKNDFSLVLGAGLGVAPYNIKFRFDAPEGSPFHFDNGKPFELQLFHNEYDGLYFQIPVSLHKVFSTSGKHNYSLELGTKLNFQNIDPAALPYQWDYSSEYEIDGNNVPLFTSSQTTNKGIAAMSYFAKLGIIRSTVNQHTLEYRLIFNWSPSAIRKGSYEFQNLPYTSRGTTEQHINFIGFEFTYGLTTLLRLGE
ncbi:MAG: hypothetical protein RIB71_21735 [Imperialibacter sp.]|uniref:hypothetical protein n=1 Tax=Imperialibacter sp. TaxID=2038411 RepID=UPI0032F006B5